MRAHGPPYSYRQPISMKRERNLLTTTKMLAAANVAEFTPKGDMTLKPKQKLTNVNPRIAGTTCPMYHGKTPDQVGEHIAEVAVKAFTTFGEHVREIRKEYDWLREYFRHKPKAERVCGCVTWKDYCEIVLGKSYQAMYYALNPEKRSTAKRKELPPASESGNGTSGLGSVSYVNKDHPDYARMQAAGLIKNEASETTFVVSDVVPLQAFLPIMRKDGSIIPQAAASVEEIVRTNLGFVISSHRFLDAAAKVQAIDQLIAKLKSERDFIIPVIDVALVTPQQLVSTDAAKTSTEPTTAQLETELDPLCLTCPRCGNQEGIQGVQRNDGQRVRRYRCTKCDLKSGCNSFSSRPGTPMEAAGVRA